MLQIEDYLQTMKEVDAESAKQYKDIKLNFKNPLGLLLWLFKGITNMNYGNKKSGIGWWKWELHVRVTMK